MVLSLSTYFYKPTSPKTYSATDTCTPQPSSRRLSTGSTVGKRPWKPVAVVSSSSQLGSHSTTLSEAFRNNPFGSTQRARAVEETIRGTDDMQQNSEYEELNEALATLAGIFPDVKIEVFRELLVRFDGHSRLEVCVEQLLRYKKEWVAGRWNALDGSSSSSSNSSDNINGVSSGSDALLFGSNDTAPQSEENPVPPEELFRTERYKMTVKNVLAKEFSSLSKSTLDAVLAEVNFSYTRARPILRDLARRTWRATFNSILPSFKRKKDKRDKDDHPLLVWHRLRHDGLLVPKLKETGCEELDRELQRTFLTPLLREIQKTQESQDFRLAEEVNESEARAADALFECECCLGDITFEQISTCSQSFHIICFKCIQRTVQEALFGQGWGKSIDVMRSTLKCIAPVSEGTCDGCLPPYIVKRAILVDKSGFETYRQFEERLAFESLLKSQMKLVRCPFCSYAEVDSAYHPSTKGIAWHFRREGGISIFLTTILLLDLIPLLLIPVFVILLLDASVISAIWKNSLQNLRLKHRPKRFTCANPSCKRASCLTCHKPWRDPHICDEPLLLDLRATVEAARTAAIKRTCPRCGLSFVKSSGCNKLTCVCGYSMCYLCRKALGPPIKLPNARAQARPRRLQDLWNQENFNPAWNDPDPALGLGDELCNPFDEAAATDVVEDDDEDAAEGYRHFCEHFRINPGSRCTECTKCDLYEAEDEEAVARRAGDRAEREWRMRHGTVGIGVPNVNFDFNVSESCARTAASWHQMSPWNLQLQTRGRGWRYWLQEVWREGRWKLEGQAVVDCVVERLVILDDL